MWHVRSEYLDACEEGDVHLVKRLTAAAAAQGWSSSLFCEGFLRACFNGRLNLAKYFVDDLGLDPEELAKCADCAITAAAYSESVPLVAYLMDHPAFGDCTANDEGWTALHTAAMANSPGVLAYMLAHKRCPPPDLPTKNNTTPLIVAARHGNAAHVRLLLANGRSNVDAVEDGLTAFLWACVLGQFESALCFAEWGLNVRAAVAGFDRDRIDFIRDGRWQALEAAYASWRERNPCGASTKAAR